jgi:hypothetical protein
MTSSGEDIALLMVALERDRKAREFRVGPPLVWDNALKGICYIWYRGPGTEKMHTPCHYLQEGQDKIFNRWMLEVVQVSINAEEGDK